MSHARRPPTWCGSARLFVGKDDSAARRVVAGLQAAIESLQNLPERGRPSGLAGVRELIVPFGRSAYLVRYAYSDWNDEIVILRIWHGRELRE